MSAHIQWNLDMLERGIQTRAYTNDANGTYYACLDCAAESLSIGDRDPAAVLGVIDRLHAEAHRVLDGAVAKCPTCLGVGHMSGFDRGTSWIGICPDCGGTGKRAAAEVR